MFVRRIAVAGVVAGVAAGVLATAAILAAAPAAAAPPAFGTGEVEIAPVGSGSTAITGVSTTHHAGFDRLVFSFAASVPQTRLRYVSRVTEDPSDRPVSLLGSAFLTIGMQNPNHSPFTVRTPKLPMLRQVKSTGDFEAVLSCGVGLASRSGFRAFTLSGPARLVIDFAIPAAPSPGVPGFGTAPVSGGSEAGPQTIISSVTVGHHAGFDRVVFSLNGPLPRYDVSYVDQVTADGSGAVVPLLGSAFLHVVIKPTSTSVHAPQNTITPGFPMLKQVKGAGDFEAVTSYGFGLASRSGFRAFTLAGPNRLVVDVAIPAAAGSGAGAGAGAAPGGAAPSSETTGALPNTGARAPLLLAVGGLGLLGVGAVGLWLGRRRHAI
ncbi:MAG TPA: LPXTG cell wall anchor domain-containing protein [Mycobacteriales bacterium]|nr:LPXTG cell wall anchor domain-containing protein [Mycobacteriales bacterium]